MAVMFAGFFFLALLFFLVHILLCVWAYRDCKRRGRTGEFALIVLLLVFFFPIAGPIVYYFIRDF